MELEGGEVERIWGELEEGNHDQIISSEKKFQLRKERKLLQSSEEKMTATLITTI